MKINKIGEVGNLLKKIEMGAPKIGKLVKKNLIGDPKVGKVGNTVRFGQVEYTKPEQDAMLAGAGEEDKFIKCSDDITGKGSALAGCETSTRRELGVYEKVDERTAVAKYNVTPIDIKWINIVTAFFLGGRCKAVHKSLPQSSKVVTGQTCMQELPHKKL